MSQIHNAKRRAELKKAAKKQTKPFDYQPDDRSANLHEAKSNVMDAIDHISSAMLGAEHWADYETMMYFRNQLEEWLSSDGGEAGFEPFTALK